MIHFKNGPAKGQGLLLKRAPTFLRVTELAGKFDGLDQFNDEPDPLETITVYLLIRKTGWMHVKTTKGGRVYISAEYELWEDQPEEEIMRSNIAWRAWCLENNPGQ